MREERCEIFCSKNEFREMLDELRLKMNSLKESSLKLEELVIKVTLMPAMREERRAKEHR